QHDAPLQRFGHTTRSLAELALNGVGLFEVRMRGVQHERLAAVQLVLKEPLEPRVPALGQPGGDVDPFALTRIEVDVEMVGLEDLKVELLILDFILSEV